MGELRSVDLDLQIVTPMMMGGADQRAEVRAPTVRGRMRFWLRALVGGVLGDDVRRVSHVEGAALGHARRGSSVAVRATGSPGRGPLPTDPRAFPGVQYMFWSAYQSRRDCLLPQGEFHLRLQDRPLDLPSVEVDGQTIDRARAFDLSLASIWLTTRFSGLGFRARRGAGGVRALATPTDWPAALPPLEVKAQTPSELADSLVHDLGQIRRFVGWEPVESVATPSSFDLLHPDIFTLQVLDRTFPTWYEALDATGQAFRSFRLRQPDDYAAIKSILTGGRVRITTVKRSIFGLPLPFFFSSLFREMTDRGLPSFEARSRASATVSPRGAERRGSPLSFRIVQLDGDEPSFCVLLLLWQGRLTPEGTLVIRPRDRSLRPVTVPAPTDYSYVYEWFHYLGQNVGPLLPVSYQ